MDTLRQVKDLKDLLVATYSKIEKLQGYADDYAERISEIQLNCEHDYELIKLGSAIVKHQCKLCDNTKYKAK